MFWSSSITFFAKIDFHIECSHRIVTESFLLHSLRTLGFVFVIVFCRNYQVQISKSHSDSFISTLYEVRIEGMELIGWCLSNNQGSISTPRKDKYSSSFPERTVLYPRYLTWGILLHHRCYLPERWFGVESSQVCLLLHSLHKLRIIKTKMQLVFLTCLRLIV